ncbi:transcriptional regulator [Prevotella sp. oral taxon 376]|uniref:transcriptional regulator n=1 Tax=Prevotella sp. oral taxon 376 TaxID=712466 RepID=UPI0035192FD7
MQIPLILDKYKTKQYLIAALDETNIPLLASMFARQPKEAFAYFRPHGFDAASLKILAKDKSFLAFMVIEPPRNSIIADDKNESTEPEVIGYFFMRSYFWGKCFRGYMTDCRHRRMGINKMMNQCATEIASCLQMETYGTISRNNIASLKSAEAVNEVRVIKEFPNGDMYVQYLPKSSECS